MAKSRYSDLSTESDGSMQDLPSVTISNRITDQYITYDPRKNRLDRVAAAVYGDDTYSWLIMCANPQYFIEFDIPKGTVIRVPFPLRDAESEYHANVVAAKDK